KVFRPPVRGVRRIRQDAVIAPVSPAREVADRHDFDRGNAERGQVLEFGDRGPESALRRESADVQLVDYRLRPRAASPTSVAPNVGRGVDHFAWAMHIRRLIARGGVRYAQPVRQHEAVSRADLSAICDELVPALLDALHRHRLAVELDLHLLVEGRPEAEANRSIGLQLGSEGHAVSTARHEVRLPCSSAKTSLDARASSMIGLSTPIWALDRRHQYPIDAATVHLDH